MAEMKIWGRIPNPHHATDEQLEDLKRMPWDDLLRASHSYDVFPIVESNRRLLVALHKEEAAIKRLIGVLVFLTVVLVFLTGILVWLGVEALHPASPSGRASIASDVLV